MTITLIREQVEVKEEKHLATETPKPLYTFGALPEGYLPDENDPAWPSKSGQAD